MVDVDRPGFDRLPLRDLSRPDYVLLAIAGVFAFGVSITVLSALSRVLGVGASAVIALVLIGDVLFRTPPQTTRPTNPDEKHGRPDYLTNVQYDSGCVEVWDHLSELRHGT